MQFSVTFRHMEPTAALKGYAQDRMLKLKKYFPDPIAVNVVMSTEKHRHCVDVNVQLHNGLCVAGHEVSENMYSSIDLVLAKLERQVKRYKDKLREHKVKSSFEPLPWSHVVLRDDDHPADGAASDAGEPNGHDSNGHDGAAGLRLALGPVVIKTEKFHANPLTPAEAIMQMNLLHQQFLVFRNDVDGSVNVVYRREDDSYGLIQTAQLS